MREGGARRTSFGCPKMLGDTRRKLFLLASSLLAASMPLADTVRTQADIRRKRLGYLRLTSVENVIVNHVMDNSDAQPERKKPGRKPGSPRVPGSGRQRGTPNAVTRDVRELIIAHYRPIEFLGRVLLGQRIRVGPLAGVDKPIFIYPSLQQRMDAAKILAAKSVPDLRSAELTGAEGKPLIPEAQAQPMTTEAVEAFKAGLVALWKAASA